MIAEYDATNALKRRYVHGPGVDEPIVWYEGAGLSNRRWLQGDERGSIVSVTDGTGATIALNAYDEYGIPASTNMGRFQYTGQTWLPEAGLYYYKARMYSATLGRFMQTDPIGYKDGINWYDYVDGDPVNRSDPTGLCTGSRIPGANCWGMSGGFTSGAGGTYGVEDGPVGKRDITNWTLSIGGTSIGSWTISYETPGPSFGPLSLGASGSAEGGAVIQAILMILW